MAGHAVGEPGYRLVGYGVVSVGGFQINWKELIVQAAQASSSVLVAQVKGLAQNVLLFTVNFVIVLVTLFFAMALNSPPRCAGSCRWNVNIKKGYFKISSMP